MAALHTVVRLAPIAIALHVLFFAIPIQAQHQDGHGEGRGHVQAGGTYVLEDLKVTESRLAEYVANHPLQVNVLDRDAIRDGHYHKVSDALSSMPGVDVSDSGAGGARVAIRGAGQGRVLVLVNGRPAGTTQYGSVNLDSFPMNMVERIEVYKPPIPVWLGGGGSGGAINIVLQREPGDAETREGRVEAWGGSFGKAGISASDRYQMGEQSLGLGAEATHRDGRRPNSDRDTASAVIDWNNSERATITWDAGARYYHSDHGSPGRTDNPTPNARQRYDRGSADLRARGFFSDQGEYEVKVFGETVRLKDMSQTGITSILDSRMLGLMEETTLADEEGKWAARFGANAKYEGAEHTLSGDHERIRGGMHGQFDGDEEAFTWILGVRADAVSDFGLQPGATAGLGVPIGDSQQFKLRAGYTTEVPTFGQLYQPSHGSIDQVRGNPNLKEEKTLNLSSGWEWDLSEHKRLACTLFREDTWDNIQYEDYPDAIKRPVNSGRTHRTGLELTADWRVATVDLEGSYVLQATRNEDNDEQMPYAPTHTVKLTARSTVGPWNTRLEGTGRARSSQYTDLDNTTAKELDGHVVFDAKVTQPFPLASLPAEAYVHVENLFDTCHHVHFGYPDDGFRVSAGMSLDF
ncbi:MAG: TonB-dependent receptor plug domain-containing protein [Desulfatibacillaceae bacterium]